MRLLLDTQAIVWWMDGDLRRFRGRVVQLLGDEANEIVVSAATVWEASIKHAKGKMPKAEGLLRTLEESDAILLPITARQADRAGSLPQHHADPFDRLLVAQAQTERLPLVTSDQQLAAYDIEIIW